MTDKLPPNLLALFAPRPALRYLPFNDHAPEERKTASISGVAQFLDKLKEPDDYEPTESWLQRRDRLRLEKNERLEKHLTEGYAQCEKSRSLARSSSSLLLLLFLLSIMGDMMQCAVGGWGSELTGSRPDDPANDPQVRGDPYRTLFVSRLDYTTKESDLEREFGRFGPIERVSEMTVDNGLYVLSF